MAIRNQPQSEKFPYASPTTPGLYVTFRAYIIELICLNINAKIGPRFWSDQKYWGPKFRREVKGVDNVLRELDVVDAVTQTAFVQIIRDFNIKSLTQKTTARRVVKNIKQRKTDLNVQRAKLQEKLSQQEQEIDTKKNSTFVDTGDQGILAKIRKIEGGQKKT